MASQMVKVPGGNVWAEIDGSPQGTPILCLHGGPGFPHDYLRPLAALNRPVVFYDQLGCGRSERPSDPSLWTLERSLEEVEAVRATLGLTDFHLFGSSWGGLLALEYALTSPTGLESLVLSSPLVSVPVWERDAAELLAQMPEADRQTIERHEREGNFDCLEYAAAVLTFWKRHVCRLPIWPAGVEAAFSGMGLETYRTMWGPSEFTQTGNLKGVDPSRRLGEISVPTFWSCGRYDEATPDSTSRWASLVQNSEFRVFAESSHMPHFEEPEVYIEALEAFLMRVDKASE